MQGDPLEVCRSNPYEKWRGSHRGSDISGRGWERSCSDYILEMEPPGFYLWHVGYKNARSQISLLKNFSEQLVSEQ